MLPLLGVRMALGVRGRAGPETDLACKRLKRAKGEGAEGKISAKQASKQCAQYTET
jgi:hypothetical protein